MNVITFFARARSLVTEAKRGLSWFSLKVPSKLVSLQELLTALIASARSDMLPVVLEKAEKRGKYLYGININEARCAY